MLDMTVQDFLIVTFMFWCIGVAGISYSYWRDTKNGIERKFFKKETENEKEIKTYIFMPILIGFMIILLLTLFTSPIWGLILIFK